MEASTEPGARRDTIFKGIGTAMRTRLVHSSRFGSRVAAGLLLLALLLPSLAIGGAAGDGSAVDGEILRHA